MTEPTLTVTDLRQYAYCPRVVYFTYVQPLERPTTYKMRRGLTEEEQLRALERRRTLTRYGLHEGQRHFDCWLRSEDLNLTGKADLLIETEDAVLPVEFKFTDEEPSSNHRLQVTAYCMMAGEQFGKPSAGGFLCRITDGQVWEHEASSHWRGRVRSQMAAIRQMIDDEAFPGRPSRSGKCVDCEFRLFCGDV